MEVTAHGSNREISVTGLGVRSSDTVGRGKGWRFLSQETKESGGNRARRFWRCCGCHHDAARPHHWIQFLDGQQSVRSAQKPRRVRGQCHWYGVRPRGLSCSRRCDKSAYASERLSRTAHFVLSKPG